MKNKIITLLIAFICLFAIAGCDNNKVNNPCPVCGESLDDGHKHEVEYNSEITDTVKLTADYAGKDFLEDGIGIVTLSSYVDGDTIIVKTLKGSKVTIRFSGINTPESTYKVEPWGFAASQYVKNKIKNSKEIVIESNDGKATADSTGNRYLGWVWVDGKLLNLELVEQALAYGKTNTTDKYAEPIRQAVIKFNGVTARIYGETDPEYDYSKEGKTLTLKEIQNTYGTKEALTNETGKGTKVIVTGTVVRKNGNSSAYIQQYDVESDEYYGIYLYGGYNTVAKLQIGYTVMVEGNIGFYYGSLQITDVRDLTVQILSAGDDNSYNILDVNAKDLNIDKTEMFGNIVNIDEGFTVTGYRDSDVNKAFSFTVSFNDEEGKSYSLDIRVDQNIALKDELGKLITSGAYFNGKKIKSIIGIVTHYDPVSGDGVYGGYIQIMLTDFKDIVFE